MSNRTSFIHQWHPQFEGIKDYEYQKQRRMNLDYFENTHSIIRNKVGWGDLGEDKTRI